MLKLSQFASTFPSVYYGSILMTELLSCDIFQFCSIQTKLMDFNSGLVVKLLHVMYILRDMKIFFLLSCMCRYATDISSLSGFR